MKRTAALLFALILSVVLAGCAVPHLHPKTGRAFNEILAKQAQRPGGQAEQPQITGEQVEIVMKNHEKRATLSEVKSASSASIGILPLQR